MHIQVSAGSLHTAVGDWNISRPYFLMCIVLVCFVIFMQTGSFTMEHECTYILWLHIRTWKHLEKKLSFGERRCRCRFYNAVDKNRAKGSKHLPSFWINVQKVTLIVLKVNMHTSKANSLEWKKCCFNCQVLTLINAPTLENQFKYTKME